MKGEGKGVLRQKFLACRAEYVGEKKCEADRRIREAILSDAGYQTAQYVAIYAGCDGEPDLLPLIEASPEKIFLLPRYNANRKEYELAEIDLTKGGLKAGRYGIMEPDDEALTPPQELLEREVFYIVPLVAVDAKGVRLGRGGGFYDRMLERVISPLYGACYTCQISAELLPKEVHDRQLDGIFTETGRTF